MSKQAPQDAVSEQKLDYLGFQAAVGVTKHDGGSKATNELIELCEIGTWRYNALDYQTIASVSVFTQSAFRNDFK